MWPVCGAGHRKLQPNLAPMPKAGFGLACHLPLCCVITICCFKVVALSGKVTLALSPSGIAPKYNRIQLWSGALGKTMGTLIDWQDTAYCLVFPLRQVELAQLYKYDHQSGNAGSSKLV